MDVGGNEVDVAVGDGITTEVAVISAAEVSVDAGDGSVVEVDPLAVDVAVADDIGMEEVAVSPFETKVSVGDGNRVIVTVAVSDIGVRVGGEIGGGTVVVISLVAVTEIADRVGMGGCACGVFAGIQNSRQININKRMSAITSLNRS